MPNPPLKRQKPSIIEVLDKAKWFIHEHDCKLESSNSSSADNAKIIELPNRPEADANPVDQEDGHDAKEEDSLLPSPIVSQGLDNERTSDRFFVMHFDTGFFSSITESIFNR